MVNKKEFLSNVVVSYLILPSLHLERADFKIKQGPAELSGGRERRKGRRRGGRNEEPLKKQRKKDKIF